MPPPRLSVIMTVRNGAEHIEEAIGSILGQTFNDFEFLIVDDGSDDATPDILARYAKADGRIRLMRNEASIGPYPSANRALEVARAPVVARMDADDISAPDRLARQHAFLEAQPDHLLVGSGYRSIDARGRQRHLKLNPMDDFALRWTARYRMPMVHPSFCFRARYPDGSPVRYRADYPVAQDYALVCDLIAKGKAASIGDPLVEYRMHQGNISTTRRRDQDRAAHEIARRILRAEVSPGVAEGFEPFLAVHYSASPPDRAAFSASVRAFVRAIDADPSPRRRRWMRRRAAGFLAEAFLKDQTTLASRAAWAAHYAVGAPGLLLPFAARVAEVRGWMRADPAPGGER